jgi:ABC-type sugar transport system, ATPase component
MKHEILLSLRNISKSYSGVKALDDVSINIKEGEVHALVGANGAGKSTLIKTISGAITPDSGEIVFDGIKYAGMTPQLSSSLGIEVIYQEFNLIPTLTVAENLFLGNRVNDKKLVDFKAMRKKAAETLKIFELDIDVRDLVKHLSVAHMQIVEIAKALGHNLRLLVLDEPTAPLTTKEVEVLYRLIRSLKEKGISIVYISHRLEEVFDLCDRITVLRDGQKITTLNTADTNRKELIRHMINSDLGDEYPQRKGKRNDTVLLEVNDLCGKGFKNISFTVREGEILGLTGLVGSKRTEIARAIFGADKFKSGRISFRGNNRHFKTPSEAIRDGVSLIPEDRNAQGVTLNLSIKWNMTAAVMQKISHMFVISDRQENEIVEKYRDALKIKMAGVNQLVSALSGGNRQKIVLGKSLASNPKLLIFDEPTRGIDVGAKKEIYNLINELADNGLGVILISSEMDEMIGLSDRMIILSEGEIMGELERKDFDKQLILDLESGNK